MKTGVQLSLLLAGVAFTAGASAQSWSVSQSKDEMTGKAKIRACTTSQNTIQQGFPYNRGGTVARLCLHKDQDGTETSLQINQGQLMCATSGGSFLLKADDTDAWRDDCVGTKSHDSEMGYFSDGDLSVKTVLQGKKIVRLETTLYSYGDALFRFAPPSKQVQKLFAAEN